MIKTKITTFIGVVVGGALSMLVHKILAQANWDFDTGTFVSGRDIVVFILGTLLALFGTRLLGGKSRFLSYIGMGMVAAQAGHEVFDMINLGYF